MEYRLQSMYNHMVGRTESVISPFYSLLPATPPYEGNKYAEWTNNIMILAQVKGGRDTDKYKQLN